MKRTVSGDATPASWFVTPETDRLELDGGQWIVVKKRLNVGEEREMFAKIYPDAAVGDKLKLELTQVGLAKVIAYLVEWSLTDASGKAVPVTESAVNRLSPDRFACIREAIEAHEERQEKARATRKNVRAGGTV